MDPDKMTRAMARWWQVRKKMSVMCVCVMVHESLAETVLTPFFIQNQKHYPEPSFQTLHSSCANHRT